MDEEIKRMRWASRRGMLELDLILGPFMAADAGYARLGPVDRQRYRALMLCEDQQLFAWFMRREVPEEPDLAQIVGTVLEFHHA